MDSSSTATAGVRCFFFRPGPYLQGGPLVTSADLTLWGLGLNGLSVRVNARAGTDLGDTDVWPGTDPPVQLLEAYADYASRSVTGRLGRQLLVSRLGIIGFDGGRALVRVQQIGLEADGYVGVWAGSSHGPPRLQLGDQSAG